MDIFDLSRIRRALRDGTFDEFCNVDDSNNTIDLFEIRKAVKEGAQAPPSP